MSGETWHTLFAIDADKWAARTYAANFPETRVECGMVGDWIDRLPGADIILGGPPCQSHSLAGKRLASKDARDGGPKYVGALRKVQPRHFLMENVPGLLSSEGGRYWHNLYASMEDAGYAVQYRTRDAVSFGVPQFRNRLWVWGIRADLYRDGMRHSWPKPTHEWPPWLEAGLFGAGLLPGVTVGEALGLDGEIRRGDRGQGSIERHGERPSAPTTKPCPTIGNGENGSNRLYLQSHADPAQSIDLPSPTLRSGGDGHDGCCLRIIGGKRTGGPGHDVDDRDITDEPAQTIGNLGHGSRNGEPRAVLYRWSNAMLQKHPPASPASPAPTVQAKYFKGGAEGLLHWKQTPDGLWVRRLSAIECLRLQSGPDDFRWPDGIGKTAMYRVVGNGWSSTMGAVFADSFRAVDPEARTLVDLFCGGGLGAVGWHGRHWSLTPEEATHV